ncbi:MAG: hypothetical protein U0W40_10675 [Acidimicrobiia bacterium]
MRALRFWTRWVAAVGVVSALVAIGGSAIGDTLLLESFTGATVTAPGEWVVGGLSGYKACLTAGSDTGQAGVPGCQTPAIDAAGSGVLQLTSLVGNGGFALHNVALPTSGGLDISFQQAQWGGSGGADGLSFFLVDGATNLTAPGGGGGNLGYSPGDTGGNGVANGLLGIGLDSWGNYGTFGALPNSTNCTAPTGTPGSRGTGNTTSERTPDRVVVRGPGNGTQGYCYLGESEQLADFSATTRAAATHTVRIVLDDATVAARNVTISFDGAQVLQIPAPPELLAASTFKFGFSGSIGGANDNHEVWNLSIATAPEPVAPVTPIPVVVAPAFTG